MKILRFLHSGQRSPEWTYSAQGTIWRILFSDTGRIVGECRDEEAKHASFFCVEEETGRVLWQGIGLAEQWWIGIEAIHQQFVFLHEYLKPDLPAHQRIRALDVESGALRWKNDDLSYWFSYRDRVYAYQDTFEKRVAYALDLENGEILETYEDRFEELNSLQSLVDAEQQEEGFRFPEIYKVSDAAPEIEKLVTKETRNGSIEGHIEIIRERDLLLMNYHVPRRNSTLDVPMLENHFAVYDMSEGARIFSEVLLSTARAPTPDSFFVKRQTAYFIKDQHILSALRLWKS